MFFFYVDRKNYEEDRSSFLRRFAFLPFSLSRSTVSSSNPPLPSLLASFLSLKGLCQRGNESDIIQPISTTKIPGKAVPRGLCVCCVNKGERRKVSAASQVKSFMGKRTWVGSVPRYLVHTLQVLLRVRTASTVRSIGICLCT